MTPPFDSEAEGRRSAPTTSPAPALPLAAVPHDADEPWGYECALPYLLGPTSEGLPQSGSR